MVMNGHEFEQTQETVEDRRAWCVTVHGVTETQLRYNLDTT